MRLWKQLSEAAARWRRDDGNLMAAAVAYYAALSLFPLMLILTSGLGMVLQFTKWGHGAREEVLQAIQQYASTSARDAVAQMLDQVTSNAVVGGPVGILTLLISAGALFVHFERAFDHIWNVTPPKSAGILAAVKNILFHRLRAFLMLLALGAVLLVNLVMSLVLSGTRRFAEGLLPGGEVVWLGLQLLSGAIINIAVFTLLYWLVPKVSVRFREALQGATLAALTWELGRWILASLVLGGKYGAYGVIGAFLVVMLWIYYAGAVLFFGAEYVQVIRDECDTTADE